MSDTEVVFWWLWLLAGFVFIVVMAFLEGRQRGPISTPGAADIIATFKAEGERIRREMDEDLRRLMDKPS